jgi:hypothetical protein
MKYVIELTKKRPQALHRGWPSGFRLHNGVVVVLQLVHMVWPSSPSKFPPADTEEGISGVELFLSIEGMADDPPPTLFFLAWLFPEAATVLADILRVVLPLRLDLR